jgi:hypothetical protein
MEDGAQKDGGKGKNKCKRSARRSARRVVDSEEETAADSGAGEGDDEGSWGGGSEPGRDDEEDEVDELQSSTRATSSPRVMSEPSENDGSQSEDDERGPLPFSAKPSKKYNEIVALGLAGQAVPRARSSAVNEGTDGEDARPLRPVRPKPRRTYRGAEGGPLDPKDTSANKDAPPANADSAATNEEPAATPMDVDPLPMPPAGNTIGTPPPVLPPSPSPLRASCPAKYAAVLKLFDTEVEGGTWKSAVDAWLTLEHATGFQVSGKALPAGGRPAAVSWWVQRGRGTTRIPASLGSEDEREDFYAAVVSWWLSVNPVWRKEGVENAEGFEARGLIQRSGGDLETLPSGLNGLTSVLACLAWWYRVAGVSEGAPSWRKLVEDVVWVLTEKHRAFAHKRAALDALGNPASKRARVN